MSTYLLQGKEEQQNIEIACLLIHAVDRLAVHNYACPVQTRNTLHEHLHAQMYIRDIVHAAFRYMSVVRPMQHERCTCP